MIGLILLVPLAAAVVLCIARLRARVKAAGKAAADYDAAVLAYEARQRWAADVRKATGAGK